jgi:hypothetical protein
VLQTVGGGYLLSVAADQLDADVFQSQVKDARSALEADELSRAFDLICQALALRRGPPFAELAFETLVQTEIPPARRAAASSVEKDEAVERR